MPELEPRRWAIVILFYCVHLALCVQAGRALGERQYYPVFIYVTFATLSWFLWMSFLTTK